MENQRNAYEKRLYVQIQEWSVDIALLSVKASMARRIVIGIALMALPYFRYDGPARPSNGISRAFFYSESPPHDLK